MTLVGDMGQRYVLLVQGWPFTGDNTIAYGRDRLALEKSGVALLHSQLSISRAWLIDRENGDEICWERQR